MKRIVVLLLVLVLAASLCACGGKQPAATPTAAPVSASTEAPKATEAAWPDLSGQSLLIYCGAGMKQPFQEIADRFGSLTGCEMNVTFANAAQIQTQISTAQEGAFFIAGAAGEVKPVEEYVASSVKLVKHIPVLAVAAGNPKGITGVADLANEDVSTVIGDAESTPIGKIAMQVFSDFGITDSVNLVATTTTAPQLATGRCGHHLEGKLQRRRRGDLRDKRHGRLCESSPRRPLDLCRRRRCGGRLQCLPGHRRSQRHLAGLRL